MPLTPPLSPVDSSRFVQSPQARSWYMGHQQKTMDLLAKIQTSITALQDLVEKMALSDAFLALSDRERFNDMQQDKVLLHDATVDLQSDITSLLDIGFREISDYMQSISVHDQACAQLVPVDFMDAATSLQHFQASCEASITSLHALLDKTHYILRHTASHQKLPFAGEVITKINLLCKLSDKLSLVSQPYAALTDVGARVQRLHAMLNHFTLNDTTLPIEHGQHQLRVIAACLGQDHTLPESDRAAISQRILDKVNESTCMQYMTKCEFYSLLMQLLASDLTVPVFSRVCQALKNKFRDASVPYAKKMEYYVCFIEMIDVHCDDPVHKQKVTTHMLGEICYDLQTLVDQYALTSVSNYWTSVSTDVTEVSSSSDEESKDGSSQFVMSELDHTPVALTEMKSKPQANVDLIALQPQSDAQRLYQQFQVIELLLKLRLESFVYTDAKGADLVAIYEKQCRALDQVQVPSLSRAVRSAYHKLCVHTYANLVYAQALQNFRLCPILINPLLLFYPSDTALQKDRFTEAIWSEPMMVDGDFDAIYKGLDAALETVYSAGSTTIFSDLSSALWPEGLHLDNDSIHRAFTDVHRPLVEDAMTTAAEAVDPMDDVCFPEVAAREP